MSATLYDWNVMAGDEHGDVRAEFVITAPTTALALHEAARSFTDTSGARYGIVCIELLRLDASPQ